MIPVLEVTLMVPSFPQESWTSKRTRVSSFEKCLQNNAGLKALPGDLLLVWEFIDFMISSKDVYVSSSQRLKSSLDIFFLLGILLRNSVVAALEVVSLV